MRIHTVVSGVSRLICVVYVVVSVCLSGVDFLCVCVWLFLCMVSCRALSRDSCVVFLGTADCETAGESLTRFLIKGPCIVNQG